MFRTRMTEAWGAPEGVRSLYLLERLLENQSDRQLVCARERATGIRRWLVYTDSPAGEEGLQAELAAIRQAQHPAISKLSEAGPPGESAWFAMDWKGEVPLDAEMLQKIPVIDRLRIVPVLISVIEHLSELGIAIQSLGQSHIWVSPALHACRLVGLSGARTGAGPEAIYGMRVEAASLLGRIAQTGTQGQDETELAGLISKWSEGSLPELEVQEQLKHALMEAVTADL